MVEVTKVPGTQGTSANAIGRVSQYGTKYWSEHCNSKNYIEMLNYYYTGSESSPNGNVSTFYY